MDAAAEGTPVTADYALGAGEPSSARVHLHMPVDIRSASLAVLAVLASFFALHAASPVFIPVLLGLGASYALNPVVDRLARYRVPRAIGAALLLAAIASGAAWTAYSLSEDATALIESLPDAAQKVHDAVRLQRGQAESAIDKVQRAAAQLEQAARDSAALPTTTARGVTRVSIERSRFDIKDYFWSGTIGVVTSIGQTVVVIFVAFFLMCSGNLFRRKIVKIAGPAFAQKRITVRVLDEISEQIHRYLLVQIFTSLLVGLATGGAFFVIGMQHAAVWGVVAFVLNFIPYVGAIIVTAGAAVLAFVQFGSLNMAVLAGGTAILIHIASGNLLTPWLTSHTSRLNPVTVFVGVLAFGWLWGIWGLLLGVPLLTSVKAVCDRVEDLKPIGELLGN